MGMVIRETMVVAIISCPAKSTSPPYSRMIRTLPEEPGITAMTVAILRASSGSGRCRSLYCPRKYDLIIGMGLGAWRRKYYELASYPSLWYASPELFREQPLTWQSDLYSLGIIFFQMLSGVLPFRSGDPAELAEMHCEYPLPEISERNPRIHISRLLYSVLIRMTMKDPALRYSSWKEFMKDLARVNEQLAEKK